MPATDKPRSPPLALLVLVLGLALSLGAAWYVQESARTRTRLDFESRARIVAEVVERRVDGWAEVLRGVRGLFLASDGVTRDEFRRLAQQLELPQRHPGFRALRFVRYLAAEDRFAFEALVRGDASVRPQGYPDFAIRPPGDRDDYYVVDYLEPLEGNETMLGFDIAASPERRRGLEEARDNGRLVASAWSNLVQEPNPRPSLVLREPVYRPLMPLETLEQRRAAFLGTAEVVLRMSDFIDATLGGELLQGMDLRLYDLGPAGHEALPSRINLLYDGQQAVPAHVAAETALLMQSLRVNVGGRVWLLHLRQPLDSAVEPAAVLVLLGGTLASLLLFRLLRLQHRVRAELASRVAARTAELATANAALRASEQRLELALAGADLGLWDWNVATGTLAWNARWLAMRGCSATELLPSVASWKGLVHPEDREAMQAALQAHLDGRSAAYVAEYRVGTGAGPWRWVLDVGRVVERDAQGRALRMAGTNLDISERKHAEEDRAAREAAERASRAKSEFLARTSHELRTPLNAILGFAQMMQLDARSPLPAAQAQRLQRIQGAGEHLLTMINEMLDLTGIEAGSVRLTLEPVALAPLVLSCLDALEPMARAAEVKLDTEIALDTGLGGAAGQVQADATRLREVLLNLLSNAVKYNRRGGWVRLAVRAAGPGRVAIAVEDSGPGLSDAQLGQLFQPFNRLGAERTGIEGTGLGLVISQRLAQLMHGSLRAGRGGEGGSVFTLELPVAQEDAPAPLPSPAPAPAPAPLPEAAAGAAPVPAPTAVAAMPAASAAPLVLYIEDEPVNALLVEHIMALRPQCRLRIAEDGESGLALARSELPALVLIDLNLPDMSGHEVLARLRADPRTRGLCCIALTADAMPDNVERARSSGFDGFWSKPIEIQAFLQRLDELLAREERRAVRDVEQAG
ncbi:hybrid sensor histidine kinase/response regulator [Azohydromonas australica]|uniref:hybrid sensor histidine kinase/response regulator n=1 Tax=Azohydromonas australica TaxID=364039 RepID=UPI000684D578|nr:CHASE domain-containing protein [Azohydromonas australica]